MKREAIDLADKIYSIVRKEEFQSIDSYERFEEMRGKYPVFTRAYPVVMRYLIQGKYNRRAFERYFKVLELDPGKGMEGYINAQAEYAKFLYIEDQKRKHQRWSQKTANDIKALEYSEMKRYMKKVKETEKKVEQDQKDNKERTLKEKKEELFEFVMNQGELEF